MLDSKNLKKFIKSLALVIVGIEEEPSVDAQGNPILNYVLHLAEPISEVRGSQVTDQLAPINKRNVNKLRINSVDWDAFLKDSTEVGDEIHYDGPLKLDVSKPKIDMRTGKPTRDSEAWLLSVPFNKRRGGLLKGNAERVSATMAALFGTVKADGTFVPPTQVATEPTKPAANEPLKVVDDTKKNEPVKAGG